MTDAFSPHIIHVKMESTCTGARLNVMAKALHPEDGVTAPRPDNTECLQ